MESKSPDIPVLLTVQELSRRTTIPERTLRHHVDKGALTARRIGQRRLYIDIEEAERYTGRSLAATAPQTRSTSP